MGNILEKLVAYSRKAIDDDVYEINNSLPNSGIDLKESIIKSKHAALITEIKFSSPALGNIRKISDPVDIARKMVNGGACALSVLTQPFLFDGSPELFMQVRKAVKIPMLMKDIIIHKIQIEAAERMGADYFLLIQSLFDKKLVPNMEELIEFGHKNRLKVLPTSANKSRLLFFTTFKIYTRLLFVDYFGTAILFSRGSKYRKIPRQGATPFPPLN